MEQTYNQTVKYRFKIIDIANNVKESRNTSVKVDTTAPEIKNLKVTKSGSYIVFNMSILNEDRYSLYRVEYIDNSALKPIWKPLCTSLRYNQCYKKVYFRSVEQDITVRVSDDAGNSDSIVFGDKFSCGDGICNEGETCSSCQTDCGICVLPFDFDLSCNGRSYHEGSNCADPLYGKIGDTVFFHIWIKNKNEYEMTCEVTEYYNNQINDGWTDNYLPNEPDSQYIGIEYHSTNYRNVKYIANCYKKDDPSINLTKQLIVNVNWRI